MPPAANWRERTFVRPVYVCYERALCLLVNRSEISEQLSLTHTAAIVADTSLLRQVKHFFRTLS